jgi:hypothetical protein
MKQLTIYKDVTASRFIISDEQKALISEELRKIDDDREYLLDWDEVKHQLNQTTTSPSSKNLRGT